MEGYVTVNTQVLRECWRNKLGAEHAEWLASTEAILSESAAPIVYERSRINGDEFHANFWAANRPVVFRSVISDSWPVRELTLSYLLERYQDEIVQVFCDRIEDGHMGENQPAHFRDLRLGEYIAEVLENPSNERYICSHNAVLQRTRLRELLAWFPAIEELCDPQSIYENAVLWLGGAGVKTWLHYDVVNSIMLQVFGRKRFLLAPPSMRPFMYNELFGYSEVDAENPNYEKYPLFSRVKMAEVTLEAGDILFVPVGWWHHVRTLESSLSVSYKNFLWPNDFGIPQMP